MIVEELIKLLKQEDQKAIVTIHSIPDGDDCLDWDTLNPEKRDVVIKIHREKNGDKATIFLVTENTEDFIPKAFVQSTVYY